MNSEFSDLTERMSKLMTKKVKQDIGFFATPNTIISKLMTCVAKYSNPDTIYRVLEPSVGTAAFPEFLDSDIVWRKTPKSIYSVEIKDELYEAVKDMKLDVHTFRVHHGDFIKYIPTKRFDLICGNPPFLVISVKEKKNIPKEYSNFITGRPNLYCLFIIHSLTMLKDKGILAFIIPKSFLNSNYYAEIRNHLMVSGNILEILDFEDDAKYIDTQQATIGFIFQKTSELLPGEYSYQIGGRDNYLFTTDLKAITTLLKNSTTLVDLGFIVKTGSIVWNEHKGAMSDDKGKTMLIYNSNITDDHTIITREFTNDEKKQYIDLDDAEDKISNKPAILVNRGNGNTKYKFTYAGINMRDNDEKVPYVVENHLNVIVANEDTVESRALMNKVLVSFGNKKTLEFIKLFSGNGGLSKTELETILPIYL
jgi:hypothetical protein